MKGKLSLRRTTSGETLVEAPSYAGAQTVQHNSTEGERQIQPSKSVVLPRVSRGIAGAEEPHQVARTIKGIGNVLFSTHSKTCLGRIKWLLSVGLQCK